MDKECKTCSASKVLDDFRNDPRRTDGKGNICKQCCKIRDYAWKSRNRDLARFYSLRYQWDNIEAYREKNRASAANYRNSAKYRRVPSQHDPIKLRANQLLRANVRAGKIKKPSTCTDCHRQFSLDRIHGHHEDYSQPLNVVWLCALCHGKRHRSIRPVEQRAALLAKEGDHD